MNLTERQEFILLQLKKHSAIKAKDIIDKFNVSDMTVRRDLSELENNGLLIRNFGGATIQTNSNNIYRFEEKIGLNKSKKEQLCKLAANEIHDNDSIFIDSGTTLYYLTKFITHINNLRIITNSLPIISALDSYPKINITLLAGEYDHERKAVFGKLTENTIEEFHCTKAFIGADGISIEKGLSSNFEKEAIISANMIKNANSVFVLADASKFNKDAFIRYSSLEKITSIITDNEVSEKNQIEFNKKNISIKWPKK